MAQCKGESRETELAGIQGNQSVVQLHVSKVSQERHH